MRKFGVFFVLLILLLSGWRPVSAQTSDSKYFNETGHIVTGQFLAFYNNNPDANYVYGYPITEQFTSKDGETVQYFQRARFELHSDLPDGQQVQLTPLGNQTYVSTGTLNVGNTFACRTYAETGYPVCFAFLEFFDKYGGISQFGYPISSFEYHENKIVQYFQNVRLEWQPWRPEGQRVIISDLGRAYFDQLGEDPALLAPVNPVNYAPRVVTQLKVRAFVWKAVTLTNDNQMFFVVVQDQNLQTVADANCTVIVNWPNGLKDSTSITTNETGVGIVSLQFNNQPYGSLIYTDISCTYDDLGSSTTTSFRVWY